MSDRQPSPALKAILFADLVQYSRLVGERETETLDFMQGCFDLFRQHCAEHGGEMVKTTGDGALVAFDSASAAVSYAVAVQDAFAALPEAPKARFRIGIHMGEVRRVGGDVYGHAVNIAARLEALASPGGVCVSQDVYIHARRGTPFRFAARGAKRLKNIPEAVAVYDVLPGGQPALGQGEGDKVLLHVIDGLGVAAGGEPVQPGSRRVRALLGHLALRSPGEASELLAALLFPGREAEAARRSLGACLRAARGALGPVGRRALVRRGDRIGLEPSLVEVDLLRVHAQVGMGEIADLLLARPDWPEAILLGLEDISPLFRSWLEVERHNWRVRISEALEASLARFEPVDAGLRRAASALLVLEPSHERATQSVIRHHIAGGNPGLAIDCFARFRRLLAKRYGIAPAPETAALIAALRAGTGSDGKGSGAEPRRSAAPVRLPAIGIGSFQPGDALGAELHLVQGFRSELLTNLSRFRQWAVLELDDRPGGERPSCEYLLAGRSLRAEAGLQLFATLTELPGRRVVWSDRFELSIAGWHEAQRLIVQRIAACLEVYVSADRVARAIAGEAAGASVYDDWLRGEHLLALWTPQAEDEAAALFEAVIARNPDFAPAYASLAGVYNVRHLIRPGLPADAAAERKALALARRAVELDPLDARNHLAAAWGSAMAGEFEQSSLHYELAVSLNPNSPRALLSCAQGLAFNGAHDEARRLLDQAIALSPALLPHQWCYIASTRWLLGDDEGAELAARRGGNATLDTPGWRAAALSRLGRLDEARAAFAEQVALVAPLWRNADTVTPRRILDWFLAAFPLRQSEERAWLGDALSRCFDESTLSTGQAPSGTSSA